MNEYTYENGKWIFHRDGEDVVSDSVSIIFDKDEPFDTLLKHGSSDKIEQLFLSASYDKLAKTGIDLVMVTVPPHCCETLNKCLSISASKWCSKLVEEISKEYGT